MANNRPVLFLFMVLLIAGCSEELPETYPFILLKTGSGLMTDGSTVPPGGSMRFGITATGGGGIITNLVVKRDADGVVTTETDHGLYLREGGLDTTLIYTRGYAQTERWIFFIMNSYRDTATLKVTVNKGEGSAWGEICHYPSVKIGMQSNKTAASYLDLSSGTTYTKSTVTGNESSVDMAVFWYITSGKSSPTLTCPAYPSSLTYYPEFESWSVRNQTLYDYYSSDNDLVSTEDFEKAKNDSLLVNAYHSQTVSGLSKYAYTGKIVPFRTSDGRYGILRIIGADEDAGGTMEVEIKIQK